MDEKDKEILTLQFSRMEEMIKTISNDTQETKREVKETNQNVKETRQTVKELDKRVRDIEEMVRTQDNDNKLNKARIDKLERITSITGFFTEHPNILTIIIILLLLAVCASNLDTVSLISLLK